MEVEGSKPKLDENGYLMPDKAQNNTFDFEAATKLYSELQRLSIPMTIVTSGADVLVAGSHVFKAEDPEDIIRTLKQL